MSFARYASSSIGKKQLMALTGLLLIGFLLAHLTGNFLIFAGYGSTYNHAQAKIIETAAMEQKTELDNPEKNKTLSAAAAFANSDTDINNIPINQYALKLRSLGPILWIMRIGLLVIFVVHLYLFIQVVTINKLARPKPYAIKASKGNTSIASTTMHYTGIIIFSYLLLHLADFTFHFFPTSSIIDEVDEGLYGLMINSFQNPIHSGLYIFAMCVLGLHITHAIQSAFQTFGINHPNYTPHIKKASQAIGVLIALGYISIPLYVFLTHVLKLGASQ
jgi:succinate dehydrogenase / fumarate reductase cytochrome b subunit